MGGGYEMDEKGQGVRDGIWLKQILMMECSIIG